MKYFLDTEFHEYAKKPLFGKPINTIDLISIGLVAEDGREYYAICEDFDVDAAWKNEWLRENVLKPIYNELLGKVSMYEKTYHYSNSGTFKPKCIKYLLRAFGKSRKEIAEDIIRFVQEDHEFEPAEFYAYYADYDWVVFCWLFGRMIDLPKGFPMYCRDLKQMLDEKCAKRVMNETTLDERLKVIKSKANYPKQENEHNALADAKWNKELYVFLNQK